jgi:hypothetical protein
MPTPLPFGQGSWNCEWRENSYRCKGQSATPPGGGKWQCQKGEMKNAWICSRPSPNPFNTPNGGAHWSCTVEVTKLLCERKQDIGPLPEPPKPKACTESCCSSQKIAFVSCDATLQIKTEGYLKAHPGSTIDLYRCEQVVANKTLLDKYDTIAYSGPYGAKQSYFPTPSIPTPNAGPNATGTNAQLLTVALEQRLNEGAKIILFPGSGTAVKPPLTEDIHYHLLKVSSAKITVTEKNAMSQAFNTEKAAPIEMAQMYAQSPKWCGDLFFEIGGSTGGATGITGLSSEYGMPVPSGVQYNGHFHGYLVDDSTRKGIFIFVGLSYDKTKVMADNPHQFQAGRALPYL